MIRYECFKRTQTQWPERELLLPLASCTRGKPAAYRQGSLGAEWYIALRAINTIFESFHNSERNTLNQAFTAELRAQSFRLQTLESLEFFLSLGIPG